VILGDQSCVRERVTVGDDVVIGRGPRRERHDDRRLTKIQADAYITAYSTLEENVFIALASSRPTTTSWAAPSGGTS
jgi:hypothetical protein